MSTELVDPMASVRAYLKAEKSSNTRKAASQTRPVTLEERKKKRFCSGL